MQAHTCCPAPGGNHNYHWANKGERKNKFHQIRTHVFDKESIKYLSHTSLQFPPSTLSNPVKLMDHHSRPNEKPGFCLRAEGPKSINNNSNALYPNELLSIYVSNASILQFTS